MIPTPAFYVLMTSRFGNLAILWYDSDAPRVQRVLLPRGDIRHAVGALVPGAQPRSHPIIAELADRIGRFLEGEPLVFSLDCVALEQCSPFQQSVLVAEHGIPRGWVSTYGRIAAAVGAPGAARAVGTALAHNPFPIIIPCHRAIRSDGGLGGFQGGIEMKRALLAMEGVDISAAGRIRQPRFYY